MPKILKDIDRLQKEKVVRSEVRDTIELHNQSPVAHDYLQNAIRALVNDLNTLNNLKLDPSRILSGKNILISQQDENITIECLAVNREEIINAIENHKVDTIAHLDLRDQITLLSNRITALESAVTPNV